VDDVYYFEEEYTKKEMVHRYPQLKDCKGSFYVAAAAPLDGYDDSDDGAAVLEQALNHAFQVNYSIIPDGCCRESDESCWKGSPRTRYSTAQNRPRFKRDPRQKNVLRLRSTPEAKSHPFWPRPNMLRF